MDIETLEPLLSERWDGRDPCIIGLDLFAYKNRAITLSTLADGSAESTDSGVLRLDVSVIGPTYTVNVPEPEPGQPIKCPRCGAAGAHPCNRSDRITKHVFLTASENAGRVDMLFELALKMSTGSDAHSDHDKLDTVIGIDVENGMDKAYDRVWSRP